MCPAVDASRLHSATGSLLALGCLYEVRLTRMVVGRSVEGIILPDRDLTGAVRPLVVHLELGDPHVGRMSSAWYPGSAFLGMLCK